MVSCLGPEVALILYAFLASSSNTQAYAALTNVTIDDTNSTFWTWAGAWNAITPATPCSECLVQPDPMQAYNSTWHDGVEISGSCTFQGSAIYIYGIDDPAAPNITFGMENPSLTSFHYYGGSDYVYHSLFFSATDLDSSAEHSVTWILKSLGDLGGAGLFDYAVVTVNQTETVPAAPLHKSETGVIAGAVVGVVGGLTLLGALLFCLRRRRSPSGPRDIRTAHFIEPYQLPELSEVIAGSTSAPSLLFVHSKSSRSVTTAAVSPTPISTASVRSKAPPGS